MRRALLPASVPDFTTEYRFLQRLDDTTIDPAERVTVRRLRGMHRKGRRRARVAVNVTGLAQRAVSTTHLGRRRSCEWDHVSRRAASLHLPFR